MKSRSQVNTIKQSRSENGNVQTNAMYERITTIRVPITDLSISKKR